MASYELVSSELRFDRREQLDRVLRRGAALRLRRRIRQLIAAAIAALLLPVVSVGVLSTVGQGDGARVRTTPADSAPAEDGDGGGGGEPAVGSTGATGNVQQRVGTRFSPTVTSRGAPGGNELTRQRGADRPAPVIPLPPDSGETRPRADHYEGDGHDHSHAGGCNVVGNQAGSYGQGLSVGSGDEDYAVVGSCMYRPSRPGGYVASGPDWKLTITRDNRTWTIAAAEGGASCEKVGFFQSGDEVLVDAGQFSHVAAGSRYGCSA